MSDKVKRVIDYEGELIGELPKVGGRNGIKVFLRECEGTRFIELRKWSDTKYYDGPGKQGITLQPDQVDGLKALIDKARKKLEG
jgi:hypothetical protein